MKINSKTIVGVGICWAGTLILAYFSGMDNHAGNGGTPSSAALTAADAPGRARTTDKEGTPTVKQILIKLKASIQGGAMQNPASVMKLMVLLDKIRSEDLQEALAGAETLTDPQQKMMILSALLGKWAETDGPSAMKYAEEHSSSTGMLGQMAKMSVAAAWAEKDPGAVWQWYQNQSGKNPGGLLGSNMVLGSLFSNMAANDPVLAFKRLEELDDAGRPMALAGIFQSALFDDQKREAVLKAVEAMPGEAERKQAKQMMLGQWAMMAPGQAMEWVRTQPQSDQNDLRQSVGTMLLMTDPKQAAAFMLEGAAETEKSARYASIIANWAAMDTNAAGTWLRQEPQGPQLDAARRSFAFAAVGKDPESAMAWAGTITDAGMRVATTAHAFQKWTKTDPAAAGNALIHSGLSEEQISQARSTASAAEALPGEAPKVD